MKRYAVIKVVYANSVREAIDREAEGMIVQANLEEQIEREDYEEVKARKRAISRIRHDIEERT